MTQRMRKLVGVPVMIGILVGWALLASEIYRLFVEGAPRWLELGYFAVAGLAWFIPAAFAINWMSCGCDPLVDGDPAARVERGEDRTG